MTTAIRKCRPDDVPELLELFKRIYRFNPRLQERDYLDWQFKNTPFSDEGDYSLWLWRRNGGIDACLGYMPIEFRYDTEIKTGCWTYNWFASDKDTSGLHLLGKLMKEYDNRLFIGLSEDSKRIYESYRVPLLDGIPRWIGIFNDEQVAALFGIKESNDRDLLKKSCSAISELNDSKGVSAISRFPSGREYRFDTWPGIRGYVRRTSRYLNWRYIDIPRHNYRAINDVSHGFAVYRVETIKHHDLRVVRMLEWNFTPDMAPAALAAIRRDDQCRNAIMIDMFCTSSDICNSLGAVGFLPEYAFHTPIPYLFRPIHYENGIRIAIDLPPHRKKRTINFNEWYITKGDGDIDRIKL